MNLTHGVLFRIFTLGKAELSRMDLDFLNPPLTERLKQILEKYPDGGQILKVEHNS